MTFVKHPLIKADSVEARIYQEILVTRIIEKGNTLVVAPTALGKTIVAVMLAAHKLKENPNSKIMFLAPTKPLAVQHEASFRKFLEIEKEKIVSITGTTSPKERERLYKECSVINATPQTIENDILTGKINLKDFELMIFDEAHRAVGDYAYVFINLQLQKQNPKSLIAALTASPGSEEEHIQDVCKNLSIRNIEIKNQNDADVKPYVNEIEIDWVRVDLPPTFLSIKKYFEDYQKRQLAFLKSIHVAVTENKRYYNRIRLLEVQQDIRKKLMSGQSANPIYYQAASKCAALLKVAHAEELIETQGIGALNNYFEKMSEEARRGQSKAAKNIMDDDDIKAAQALTKKLFMEKVQHPKYAELKRLVLAQLAQKPDSKVIVFNHYRDSISEVVTFLNEEEKINATKFIGQATKGKEKGMSQKLQQQILDELRGGKHNVLVTSSVAEEGLDIPSVELVVFFEPVPSEIRTIQRRGRTGRFGKGKAVILMARNTRDEAFYWTARSKERKMKETLHSMKTHDTMRDTSGLSQTILSSFEERKKDQIMIFVDTREHASGVTKKLFDMGVKTVMKQLDIGDFILSKDVCVERKTVSDFIESVIDGRLFKQMMDIKQNYTKPLVILEGNMQELYTIRNIHRNSIIGALTSTALDYQVPLLNTKNEDETAEYLYVIAKREQIARDKEIRIRVGRKGLTISEQQKFIIEGLPLVGPTMAKSLLEKFESVKSIMNASEKDLQLVDNMGKKKARMIQKVLSAKYSENSGETLKDEADEENKEEADEEIKDEDPLEEGETEDPKRQEEED